METESTNRVLRNITTRNAVNQENKENNEAKRTKPIKRSSSFKLQVTKLLKPKQKIQSTQGLPPPAPYLTHSSSDGSLKNEVKDAQQAQIRLRQSHVQLQNKLFPKKFEKSDSTSHLHRLEALRIKYQNGATLKTSKTDSQLLLSKIESSSQSSTLPRPLPAIPTHNRQNSGNLNESFTKALQNLQNQKNMLNRKTQPKIGTSPVYRQVLPDYPGKNYLLKQNSQSSTTNVNPLYSHNFEKYPPPLQAMHNKHSIQQNRQTVSTKTLGSLSKTQYTEQTSSITKPVLKLGNSVAHNFKNRKSLVERGQLAGLQLNSKLHEYVKHQDKLLCNEQELAKFEQFVVRLERLSLGDISEIDQTMVEKLERQEAEILLLKQEKDALLDKVFEKRLNDTNATFLD